MPFFKSLPVVLLVGASALAGPIARDQNAPYIKQCTYKGQEYYSGIEQLLNPKSDFCLSDLTREQTIPLLVDCWNEMHPGRKCTDDLDLCDLLPLWGPNAIATLPGPQLGGQPGLPEAPGQPGVPLGAPRPPPGGPPITLGPGYQPPAECIFDGREFLSLLDQILDPTRDFCLADLDRDETLKHGLNCWNKIHPECQCTAENIKVCVDLNLPSSSTSAPPFVPHSGGDPGHSLGGPDAHPWWNPTPPSGLNDLLRPTLDLVSGPQGGIGVNVNLHNGDDSSSNHKEVGNLRDGNDGLNIDGNVSVYSPGGSRIPSTPRINNDHDIDVSVGGAPSAPGSIGVGDVLVGKCDKGKGDNCECDCK